MTACIFVCFWLAAQLSSLNTKFSLIDRAIWAHPAAIATVSAGRIFRQFSFGISSNIRPGSVACGSRSRGGSFNSDIANAYLGLLINGKSHSNAGEKSRGDVFAKQVPGISLQPASPTLSLCIRARTAGRFNVQPLMMDLLQAPRRRDCFLSCFRYTPLVVSNIAQDD